MERVFPLYGIRFISVNDAFDSNKLHGDTGGINVAFQYLIAEFYSRDLSNKTRSAQLVKFRRGEYQSKNCLYGYQKGADGRLEPDEKTAPNVRLIFELSRDGHRLGEIVKILFDRGIPTPGEYKTACGSKGYDVSRCCRIWSKSVLSTLLNDERYTGCYIMGRREVVGVGSHKARWKDESQWIKIPNHYPAIISKELFDQVQSMRKRFKPAKRTSYAEYPLRHKVFCGCCLHALSRTTSKKPSFICKYTAVDETSPCNGLRILESDLEQMLYEILSKQAQAILNLDDFSKAEVQDIRGAKQDDCRKRINELLDQKCGLYEQFSRQIIAAEEYRTRKTEIDREVERLKQVHSMLAAQAEQMRMAVNTRKAQLEAAHEIVDSNGLTADLCNALIERVYVCPDKQIKIEWKQKDLFMEATL